MNKIIFANWKMNLSLAESVALATALKDMARPSNLTLGVFPSFGAIEDVAKVLKGNNVIIGAQDCFWEASGAYTGEVSPTQLKELGCTHVLVGHSERRHKMGETDEMVNAKLKAVLAAGMQPVLCVGETDDERRHGKLAYVLERQVATALKGVDLSGTKQVIIAYEPVWAIGTGQACDAAAALAAHSIVRNAVLEQFAAARASKHFQIIYGGSVDAGNINAYLSQDGIDGALVGGASQKVASLAALLAAAQ